MSTTFTCDAKEFKAGIKHLQAALPKGKRALVASRTELNIRPDHLVLTTVGASYRVDGEASQFEKVIMPTSMLIQIGKAWKSQKLTIEFSEGEIRFGGTSVSSKSISMIHPENQSSMDLTINYKVIDLLRLRHTHSNEELERMNLLEKLRREEDVLRISIEHAHELLKGYGVTYRELEELIEGKVQSKS